ncbi:hydroxyjasmonate sulfotransferase [Ranunculus cassubicifolius]
MDITAAPTQIQQFEDLLQSLLSEIGATNDLLYLYQGFWYRPGALKGFMAAQKHFQAQPTDIILVTAAKSGTTWLKALAFVITHRSQYTVNDPDHPLLTNNPHNLVPSLNLIYGGDKVVDHSINSTTPRLFAAHVHYATLPDSVRSSKCRVIYMCRNPKDIFLSMWHFGNKILSQEVPLEQAFNKFCDGVSWYGPLWEQAVEYWKLSLEKPEEVLFLKFEDLKEDCVFQLKRMAEYLGCPFSMKEESEGVIEEIVRMCSFECLSNLEVNKTGKSFDLGIENRHFFRKGEVGDWMNVLTPSMVERLDQVLEQKLHGSGLNLK